MIEDVRTHGTDSAGMTVVYQARMNCEVRQEPYDECQAHWRTVLRLPDHETHLGEFDVVCCGRCHLGFTNPYPTEETSQCLYDTRMSGDFDRPSSIDALKDWLSRRQLTRLAPHDHIGAVLDYGTGNGRYAMAAARVFPHARVDAVDSHDTPPPLLRGTVTYFSHTAFAAQDQRYDLILLRHVLEHTHHPVSLVRLLADRLAPDGVLYIEVPNLESGCAKFFGRYWKGYYVPRHIFHFTMASLTEIVQRAGLTAEAGRNEMPLMGNTLANLTGMDQFNVVVRGMGRLLHPIQLAIEGWYGSSTCIHARCRHPHAASNSTGGWGTSA